MADEIEFVDAYDSANHGKKCRVPAHFVGPDSPFPNLRKTPLSRSSQTPADDGAPDSKEKK